MSKPAMALSKAAAHGNARVGSGFGMNAKRKGWLESAKIFLYVGFPIGFTILQAKPEVMGWVVQNREYVRFPAESKDSDCDTDKIRREAKMIKQLSKEESEAKSGHAAPLPMTAQLQGK